MPFEGDDKKKRIIYDVVSQDYDIGTYDEFSKKMDISDSRKKLYDAISADFDLGDYETFNNKLGYDSKETKQQSPIPNVYDPQAQMKQSLGFASSQPSTKKQSGNDNRYLDFGGTGIEEVKPKPIVNKSGTPIGAAVGKDKKIGGSTAGAVYNSLVDLAGEIAGGGAYVGTNIVNLKEGIPYVPGV